MCMALQSEDLTVHVTVPGAVVHSMEYTNGFTILFRFVYVMP